MNIPPSIPPNAYIALLILSSHAVLLSQPLSPNPDLVKNDAGILVLCITREITNRIKNPASERKRELCEKACILVAKRTGMTRANSLVRI